MASSILSKVGKTIEMSAYISVGVFLISLVVRVFAIWYVESTEVAGPQFYYWRREFCDSNIAKSAYKKIKINAEAQTDVFKMFAHNCLEVETPAGASKPASSVNQFGATPLCPIRGKFSFSDAILVSPSKIHLLFGDKCGTMSSDNKRAFEIELQFLAFRNVFLTYMVELSRRKGDSFNTKTGTVSDFVSFNFTHLTKAQVDAFFDGNNIVINNSGTPGDKANIVEIQTIDNVNVGVKLIQEHYDAFLRYLRAYDPFKRLFNLLETQEGLVAFDDEKKETTVNQDLLDTITAVITALELNNEFGKDQNTLNTNIKDFMRRIAIIKPTVADMRILNRLYYCYLIMNSFLNPTKSADNEDLYNVLLDRHTAIYQELKTLIVEYQGLTDDSAKEAKKLTISEKLRRLEITDTKIYQERIIRIFNNLSANIAKNLGNMGIVLKSTDDNRKFLDKYVLTSFLLRAYPKIYTESELESVKPAPVQETSAPSF